MRFKLNSALGLVASRTIRRRARVTHDSLSERFGLRPIMMWRLPFWPPALSLLPRGMRCAIVTSAEHFQRAPSPYREYPTLILDTRVACTVQYLLSRFALVTRFSVRNSTYYGLNILPVTQRAVVLRPVIKKLQCIPCAMERYIGHRGSNVRKLRLCKIYRDNTVSLSRYATTTNSKSIWCIIRRQSES